jgi:hypothetical protein
MSGPKTTGAHGFGPFTPEPRMEQLLTALSACSCPNCSGARRSLGVPATRMAALYDALVDARDVLEGLNDDEINLELLPRLNAVISNEQVSA